MQLTDALRKQYLAAMGITPWERRAGVPAAPGGSVSPVASVPVSAPPIAPDITTPANPPVVLEAGDPGADVGAMDWDTLALTVSGCTRCELHKTRTQTVFGVGPRRTQWLFVGEAPGAEEDRQGEPFVGPAGQLLNAMLFALGLKRTEVYIANVLKCRPPGNRDPQPQEVSCCEPYLLRQIGLLQPRVIVALGRHAAHSLLKSDLPLSRLRTGQHAYHGIPLVVTYHPAYLLRTPSDKRKTWEDLCRARAIVRAGA
jgi:DNA polymerase